MLVLMGIFISFSEYVPILGKVEAPFPDIEVMNAVINGPIANIEKLDKEMLLFNLQFLQNIDTSRERKRAVFMTIKGKRRFDEMDMSEIEKIGVFLKGITSYHLKTELDCNKVHIVSFLGRMKLRKKLLGVLAQCLKKEFGKQVYQSYRFINKFLGIICGYGVEELEQIDEDNFILIEEEVFLNLDECNPHQLKALYEIAVKPTVYGIPQGWNKSVVRTIGTLLSITPLKDLLGMDYRAFTEINPKVLRVLSFEKLEVLKIHLRYFGLHSKNEIWRIVGIPSGSVASKGKVELLIFKFMCLYYYLHFGI
ncbi:uncharacterized protein LOC123312893 [Coccinella septempunctata]|uniref:uncharacterized protein LOC123312893 n=1 Tax=Coccinella septempunctata TaxID=41139 RepID=UPI001D0949A3|nr:uncharacterized protein LOC123312893 [Coccinella septempunctata]